MTYAQVALWCQLISLWLFIAFFVGVVTFAYWPKNRARFEAAQREALDLEKP